MTTASGVRGTMSSPPPSRGRGTLRIVLFFALLLDGCQTGGEWHCTNDVIHLNIIELSPDSSDLPIGEDLSLQLHGFGVYCSGYYCTSGNFAQPKTPPTWTSDRPSVASVSAGGTVRGRGNGVATVTVSAITNGECDTPKTVVGRARVRVWGTPAPVGPSQVGLRLPKPSVMDPRR